MTNFKKIARNTLLLSALMEGRTQIKTDELNGKIVTIMEFDFVSVSDESGNIKTFPIILLAEYPDKYYNGGAILSKLCQAWAAEFDGDIEQASDELRRSGGVQVKISESRTKQGRNLTTIEVI